MRVVLALIGVAVTGCSTTAPTIQLVVDGPFGDPDAIADGLDDLTLAIAHEGDAADLVSQSAAPGRAIDLAGVPFADDLVVHLTGRIGGDDVAYGRTCSFAFTAAGTVDDPHLFFARNVKFASVASTTFARRGGQAITYHDGSGVLLGGVGADGMPVRAVERFDPRTGATSNFTTIEARTGAVTALLGLGPSSRIAVIGGNVAGTGAAFLELVEADAARGQAVDRIDDAAGAMAREGLTATALTDGRVVVIGGAAPGGLPSGTLALITSVAGAVEIKTLRAVLAVPRVGHTATRLGDGVGAPVLIAGGLDGTGQPIAVAELFHPLSSDLAVPTTFAPHMVVPRSGHLARLMPDGSVLIIGGIDATGAPVRTLERFSLDTGFVAVVGALPATAGVIGASATTLPDGRILLVGGTIPPATTAVDVAFIARLDVTDGSVDVVATDRLAVPRTNHQAMSLCDGTVLVSGGTDTSDLVERYNPPALGRR